MLSLSLFQILLIDIYFVFECTALIVVIIQYKKLKHTAYKYFLPYLIFIVVFEFLNLWDWLYINHSNLYLVNITDIIQFVFMGFFLRNFLIKRLFKKISLSLILITLFCSLMNMAFLQGFWKMDSASALL